MNKLTIESIHNKIIHGNAQDILPLLPGNNIQVCITSPPYWGLRDYGLDPVLWDGDPECEHLWREHYEPPRGGNNKLDNMPNVGANRHTQDTNAIRGKGVKSQFCQKCGCWKGCLGLEPTPELYIRHLVDIFNEVKRILRPDGTCWVNIGDSYIGGKGQSAGRGSDSQDKRHENGESLNTGYQTLVDYGITKPSDNMQVLRQYKLKPKDLALIPFRLAIALQEAGWWVRSDIIWAKPNPMPESVIDRPTKSHEYIFLLAKSQKYYYDADAIREPLADSTIPRKLRGVSANNKWVNGPDGQTKHTMSQPRNNVTKEYQKYMSGGAKGIKNHSGYFKEDGSPLFNPNGRNKYTVWNISTKPYPEAHFATFPPEIPEICIKAGSKPGDIVLDPFAGSGTTCALAKSLDRNYIGIEANLGYIKLAEKRIANTAYQPSLLDRRAEYV